MKYEDLKQYVGKVVKNKSINGYFTILAIEENGMFLIMKTEQAENSVQNFIVASDLDELIITGQWNYGHYFTNIYDAVEYIKNNKKGEN